MKKLILWIIKIYQKTLSLDHGLLGKIYPNLRGCKFTPTCSEYMYGSVEKYGVFKGVQMGISRLSRCTPSTVPGKYDPVP
jgi:putative component of membrane protein insertase Oxa1/YidC/SpoIIIJ protein YidD